MRVENTFIPVGAINVGAPADFSVSRTLTPPAGATKLLIQAFTQNLRYTIDGTTPTASVGFQLKAGDPPREIDLLPVRTAGGAETALAFKAIQEAATAVVQFQWGR